MEGTDPLDPATEILVTVEEPLWFTSLLSEPEWDQPFRDYLRDAMHQIELEAAARVPVISVTITNPKGIPAVPARGQVLQVTRKYRDRLEQGIVDTGEIREVHLD